MKKLMVMVTALGSALIIGGTSVSAAKVGSSDPMSLEGIPAVEKITPGYQRIEIWKITSRYKYKVVHKSAKTYKISGTQKKAKLKVNHYMKNYKNAVWTRKKITQVKYQGKWLMYYYVTTKKNHAGGWIKWTDVKVVSPRPSKADKHHLADFDTWYSGLSQAGRNWYSYCSHNSHAADIDVNGEQVPAQW